ncbi:cytochrome c family protein [Marinobacter vulgaris]|uniref:cytochrome c family protein n=1 Tax=Marinobacter vulgaris TaxID=1928331 RepID=UPI002228567C|nr:cytochrome c family protein [Marinobacter vulgaris]
MACHKEAAEAWSGSHHAQAWTMPSPETVAADFDGTVFKHDWMTARFRTKAGVYHVEVTEKDGATTDYRVHSVAGVEPLQQYLIETEPGRLQSFDVVWDTEQDRWFHLYPSQDLPPVTGCTGLALTKTGTPAARPAMGLARRISTGPRVERSVLRSILTASP